MHVKEKMLRLVKLMPKKVCIDRLRSTIRQIIFTDRLVRTAMPLFFVSKQKVVGQHLISPYILHKTYNAKKAKQYLHLEIENCSNSLLCLLIRQCHGDRNDKINPLRRSKERGN